MGVRVVLKTKKLQKVSHFAFSRDDELRLYVSNHYDVHLKLKLDQNWRKENLSSCENS